MIYEVNLKIANTIDEQYQVWLKEHVKTMLDIRGFCKASWFSERGLKDCNFTHNTLHYEVDSMNDLENYLENHAQQQRVEGQILFGNQFSATRRVLELQQSFIRREGVKN